MKKNPRLTSAVIRRRRRRFLGRLRILALLGLATSATGLAVAQTPTGGSVVAGAATINSVGSTLNVNASTDRAVVNWNSFSVGQGNTANFNLPSASSAILNRVTTPGLPSVIAGQLNSNGNVFLVNPSGVVVGNTGAINTNGFTASTFDTTNREFMNGGPMSFRGSSHAGIVNNGTINTGAGGAHFIGNQFTNNGSITSAGGSITVGRGQAVTYANGVTHVEADMATLQNGYSETAGLINNSGTMRATGAVMSGGDVYLTNPGGRVLNSGVVAGGNVAVQTGRFNQAGTIDVSGPIGGQVVVNSDDALLQGTINASGTTAGGRVEISSGSVDQFAAIDVSSISGTGGDVSITTQSGYTATSAGEITADGRDGGNVLITGPGRIVTSAEITAVGHGGDGGNINIASDFKTSLLSATVDASGSKDGGQIRIGGEYQGGRNLAVDELVNSSETLIGQGTELNARGDAGVGGTAIVWSEDRTQFFGGVDVTGQTEGGFVELSSAGNLVYQTTDEILTGGGQVLLDPKNGIIVDTVPTGLGVIEFALARQTTVIDQNDQAGQAVALTGNGRLLAVGVPGDDGGNQSKPDSGAVFLFALDPNNLGGTSPTSLRQIVRDGTALSDGILTLDAGDRFGTSVALNFFGGILAVGAPDDDPVGFDPVTGDLALSNTGAVYLFNLNPSNPTAPLTLGNVIRHGSPLFNSSSNSLDLLANESPMFPNLQRGNDRFGHAVALGNGNRLAVSTDDNLTQRVYLFELSSSFLSVPPTLGQVLQPDMIAGSPVLDPNTFADSLALNQTGDLLAVGASREGGGFSADGAVYLFELNSRDYSQPAVFQQRISNGTPLLGGGTLAAAGFELGAGVAFANNGQVLAIGSPGINSPGEQSVGGAVVLSLNPADYSSAPEVLFSGAAAPLFLDNGETATSGFDDVGQSIAISGDGSVVALGAPFYDGFNDDRRNVGTVLLFSGDATGQTAFEQILTEVTPFSVLPRTDDFADAVALNDAATKLAVSGGLNRSGDVTGDVYLFDLDPSNLGQNPSLSRIITGGLLVDTPSGVELLDLGDDDLFGSALSYNSLGDRLAIGATGDDFTSASNTDKGAIYLFEIDLNDSQNRLSVPQVLREQSLLSDGSRLTLSNSSEFGTAVALDASGNRLVAGQSLNDRVFLFEFDALAGFAGPASLAQTIENGLILADGSSLNLSFTERIDNFGTAVAISRDGSVLAVGEQEVNRSSVLLFDLDQNDWSAPLALSQRLQNGSMLADGSTLDLGTSAQFGASVALSAIGDRLVVGQAGTRLHLFELNTMDFSAAADRRGEIGTGTVLLDGGVLAGRRAFGSSVSISGDGNVIATGDDSRDQVSLFEFTTGDYGDPVTLQNAVGRRSFLSEFDGLPSDSEFGGAVAINGTGDRLAVQADSSVFLFHTDTTLATDPALKSVIRDGSRLSDGTLLEADNQGFGEALAFNDSGNLLAVGDPTSTGSVSLFALDSSDLSVAPRLGQILADGVNSGIRTGVDLDSNEGFGSSVAFNASGDRLAVGSVFSDGLDNAADNASGSVYLFNLNPNDLTQTAILRQIVEDNAVLLGGATFDLEAFDNFGTSVSLNAVGDRLAVGAIGDDGTLNDVDRSGAVYLFELDASDLSSPAAFGQVIRDGSTLADGSTLQLDDRSLTFFSTSDLFGFSVALDGSGSRLFVGAPGDDGIANTALEAGSVTQFDLNASDYTQAAGINQVFGVGGSGNPGGVIDISDGDWFGSAVDVNSAGSLLAVGAFRSDATDGNVREDVGSVFLIGAGGGGGAFPLTGDLAFDDFPADTTIIDPDDIAAILNAGNDLTLQFSNDLEIRSDITTAMTGVGTLTVQTGRSINVLPGVDINIGDGSLDFEFNSPDALTSQTEPGSPTLRLNGVSITASGPDSLVNLSAGEFEDFFTSDEDPLLYITDSMITSADISLGDRRSFFTEQRIVIDGGTVISGERVFLRGANNTSGIGTEITDVGTEVVASERLEVGGFGGLRLANDATLRATDDGRILFGLVQLPNAPEFDALVQSGDSIFIDNASILTENGSIEGEFANLDVLAGQSQSPPFDGEPIAERNFFTLIDSQIVAGGMGEVRLGQVGDDAYQFELSNSIISGQNVLIALNLFAFNTDSGVSTFSLTNQSQINTAPDGRLQVFIPQQAGVVVDSSSSLNGVFGNSLFDASQNLISSQGVAGLDGNDLLSVDYVATPEANFAFYLATTDLTPGLFVTANDGQSTYGQVPIDPGISITRGVLLQGDTLESIGVGTDFDLTRFSDAGSYVINVEASDLNPAYRLLGTASGTFTILPADLFVTGGTYSKTYGETFVFPENDFTVEGLVNNEMIGPVEWLSLGTRPTADVMDAPYAVGLSVSGQGSFNPLNYSISFTNGGLTVNPAPLAINPLAQSKVYGDAMLDQSRFNAVGLKNGETINGVSFTSPGIDATADVGNYNLRAAMVTGSGNGFDPGNYMVQFGSLADGLMVTPASLQIRALDQFKLFGESFVFDGDEFTTNGLKNRDSVVMATLTSDGATEDAELGTSPIVLTDPVGDFDPTNYVIQIVNGNFIVQEEPVAPVGVLSTSNLVYDQFGRYRDFAETIDALIPANVGSIDTSNALPTEPPGETEQPGDDAQDEPLDQPEDDGEIYLSTTIRPR